MAAPEAVKTETAAAPVKVEEKKGNEPVKFQGSGGQQNQNPNFNNRGNNRGNRRPHPFNRGGGAAGGGGGGNRQNNRQFGNNPQFKREGNNAGGNDAGQGAGNGPNFNRRPPHNNYNQRDQRGAEDRFHERIATISGPTIELPPIDAKEKKFAGRCRLYIGNLSNDVTQEELEGLFKPYGESSECFINTDKNFAFIRMDFRANAEKARRELDGFQHKNRSLRVRFAPHSSAIKVKNLNQFVTNELLEWGFQVFGEIERAVVIADERGKSIGEGIVEFARKPGAASALKRCSEGSYFLTGSLRPVIVEPFELVDDTDGYSEKSIFKKTKEFFQEREVGPRFAQPNSFEAEYGNQWKALAEEKKKRLAELESDMKLKEEKLEAQMEYARYEHETEMLREQLRQREQDKERQKREWELKERAAEEHRRGGEDVFRQAEEAAARILKQEEERRRRQQESSLLAQAQQLSTILEQHEQAINLPFSRTGGGAAALMAAEGPKSLMDSFDGRLMRGGRDEQRGPSRWAVQDRRGPPPLGNDDFQNKRRRY